MPTPTFTEKDYQQRALERFDAYLAALEETRKGYEEILKIKLERPDLPIPLPDFAGEAWAQLGQVGLVGRPGKPYSPRLTGDKQPVPNATFKLPTGGGKTYLAAAAVAKLLTQYVRRDEPKFVLWVVPSEAIYSQTKAILSDREHPYRQLLDRASGGRVRILERESPLHADDVLANLNVMLLMLPAANRETKEQLRMFRDRGNVNGFFPADDDRPAHEALWKQIPNLNYVAQGIWGDTSVGLIRSSLGNVLRLLRPIVVMDEGQKAFSNLAHSTLYDFNPRFVVELSATPKDADSRWSNWLTDIRGTDLEKEEMIKMPIILHAQETTDWRDCLRQAWERTKELQLAAERLRDDTNRYIRPILLVQVERTGKEVEGANEIHANQAREHLISLGVDPEAVRLKTATENEIADEDLLADDCPVRAIITKSALQEGWDCPFAYVLCSLIPANSLGAMTQMVGRILRQPQASKTGIDLLDQCYVFTHFAQTKKVFEAIKKGLEGEGMGDLAGKVKLDEGSSSDAKTMIRERRAAYAGEGYYLPKVVCTESDGTIRELDWESDILGQVNWTRISIAGEAAALAKSLDSSWGSTVAVGLGILTGDNGKILDSGAVAPDKFDLTYAVRVMGRDIPNPFIAARIIGEFLEGLRANGWDEGELALQQRYITEHMLGLVKQAVEAECRAVFDRELAACRIRFNLRTEAGVWKVPDTTEVAVTGLLGRDDGNAFQLNLFDPVQKNEVNGYEYKVASYIDKTKAVEWWYRNVVHQDYHLQGWKKTPKVFPDFILARKKDGTHEWVVLETKGAHLEGFPDTTYKKELAETLVKAFEAQRDIPALGELELVDTDTGYVFKVLMQTGWEVELSKTLA